MYDTTRSLNYTGFVTVIQSAESCNRSFILQRFHVSICEWFRCSRELTEDEMSVLVLDSFGKVDVSAEELAVLVAETSTEDWDLSTSLNGEVNVLSGVRELFINISNHS